MERNLTRTLQLLLATACFTGSAHGQLTVQNTLTPAQLVNDILAGQGVTVSNILFNGAPANTINDQIASFNGASSNLGLNDGIVMATGRAVLVEGPNMNTSLTVPPAFPVNSPDPDLAYFVSSQKDVAVLEFDFIPTGDSLNFRFVFGSEEYPEYVCSQYNDVFGFFLSGPGISGPYTNNAVNLGVLPGTAVPVAINTVNAGTPGILGGGPSGCNASDPNWQANAIYYVGNVGGATVELDGFTVPLRARAAVRCGETYHIKIAIAHAGDASLDSAVLIEGGSFTSTGSLGLTATTPQQDGTITEGCGDAIITITRPDTAGTAMVDLGFSGPGITPADLDGASSSILLPSGVASISFPLGAIRDQETESAEPMTLVATWVSPCGVTLSDSITLVLLDHAPIDLIAEDLYLNCEPDSAVLSAQVSGGLGEVVLAWGSAGSPDPFLVPGQENATYTVTATDQCPDTVSRAVRVISGCDLLVPNVITPNSDGVNDAWKLNGLSRSGHSVQVFNRWGNLVFSAGNYANNWRAPGLPDGTYFYHVVDGRTGELHTGTLTILANGRQ